MEASLPGQSVSVGVAGWTLQAKGAVAIYLVIGLAVAGSLLYGYGNLRADSAKIHEELQVLTYILSQPIADRPKLAVPQSLRERMR